VFSTVHGNERFRLSNGWEFIAVLFPCCVSLLPSGAGVLSLDGLIKGPGREEFRTRG